MLYSEQKLNPKIPKYSVAFGIPRYLTFNKPKECEIYCTELMFSEIYTFIGNQDRITYKVLLTRHNSELYLKKEII